MEGIKDFVDRVGKRQGYKLEVISKETADMMMLGQFNTLKELEKFEDDLEFSDNSKIHILYKEDYIKEEGKYKYTIETIILDEQ